jgi:hypothetical protein
MPPINQYEELDEEQPEVIVLRPGEEAPKEPEDDNRVSMTKEEFEELRKKTDIASRIPELIQQFGNASRPVNIPPQQKHESEEEFATRLETELFKPGNAARVIREAVDRISKPQVAALASVVTQQARKLLEVDPEKGSTFKRFQKDIDAVVANLPPETRSNPAVYEWAYNQVVQKNSPSLEEERINAAVEKRLAEMGISTDGNDGPNRTNASKQPQGRSPSFFAEGGSRTTPSRKPRYLTPTHDDVRNAEVSGVPLEIYMDRKAKP